MPFDRDFSNIIDVSLYQNTHGRSYCNICKCELTLGVNSNDFVNNLNVHANGKKHQRLKRLQSYNNDCSSYLDNKLTTDKTENNVKIDSFDWEKGFDHDKLKDHGILINKNNNSIYCYFCRKSLPQLSCNVNANKYNIKTHITGKKHIQLKLSNICETSSSITSKLDDDLFNSNSTSKTFSTKIVNIPSNSHSFEWEKDFDCNKLKDYGIVINQNNNTVYCYFCNSFLPQLSDDVNSNIYNIKTHVISKKHIQLQSCKELTKTSDITSKLVDDRFNSNSDSTSKNSSINEIVNITSVPSFYDNQLVGSKENKKKDERTDFILKKLDKNLLFNRDYLTCISKFECKCSLCDCNIELDDDNNYVLLDHLYSNKHLTKLKCIQPKHYFISVTSRQNSSYVKNSTSNLTITTSDNQSSDTKNFKGRDKNIDFIFRNTDERIIFNRNYITYVSTSLYKCTLCSCVIRLHNHNNKFLLDHFYGNKHIKKLRNVSLSYASLMCDSKRDKKDANLQNKLKILSNVYIDEMKNIISNKHKNTNNRVDIKSDCVDETDKNMLFISNLFSYFIPWNLQPVKQYISYNSDDDFFCSVCHDYCLTEGLLKKNINCVNFSKILVEHCNTDLHTMSMCYQLNYIDASDSDCSDYDFLIKLLNEIPDSIDYFNINDFIMVYNNIDINVCKIKCKACSTFYTVDKETPIFNNNILFKHIISNYHKKNSIRFNDCDKVKNNLFLVDKNKKLLKKENYLTKDVLSLILDEFEDDKTYLISYKSKLNQIVCKICLCKIYLSSEVKKAKINIIEHLNGKIHKKLKEYEKINQSGLVFKGNGDLMKQFLQKKCEYHGQMFCDVCVVSFERKDNSMHFKSETHIRNCYKKGNIFIYLCKRFSLRNKEIRLKNVTKTTCYRVPKTINAMIETIFKEFPSNLFKHRSYIIVNNHDFHYVLCRICYCEFKIINYNNLKNNIYFHISSRQHNLNLDETKE
ncbi:uncharacterized protein LOC142319378 [Lycorma delicatula]|uniref:uncharacterized protein LOC142319378 n=1 Tax=Lycorma delicatula TaxID=130591 RepID=UPI003F5121D7